MALETNPGEAILSSSLSPPRPGLPIGPAAVPPLNVSGLVITRADLVAALRIYVAQLADITPLEGDRFLLSVAPASAASEGREP